LLWLPLVGQVLYSFLGALLGTNWSELTFHTEVHMGGQQLWCYLMDEQSCPPTPRLPTLPTYAPDTTDVVKKPLLEAFEAEMETYQSDLDIQATWLREEACAKAILLASMEVDISLSLRGLSTSHLMWAHLHHSYEKRNEALNLAVVEEAQSLRQHEYTEFHCQLSAIWLHLDSIGVDFCVAGTCKCCDRHRGERETLRLHEFMSRLQPELRLSGPSS